MKAMDPMMLKTQKTLVWWDINSCPVPDGYDAYKVRQCIESTLRKAGNSGPLTITAIGNLKHTLKQNPDVLPAISSTGIFINHVPAGFFHIFEEFLRWTRGNPPPATLMIVTGDVKELNYLSCAFFNLDVIGYTLIHAFPQSSNMVKSQVFTKCIWENLLEEETTTRHALEDKLCETGESSCRFFCTLCKFAGQSFEDCTTHLKGRDHLMCHYFSLPPYVISSSKQEMDLVEGPPPKMKLVKPTFNVFKYVNKQTKDSNWEIEEDRLSL